MTFVDKELTCLGCESKFVFSAGEQTFFRDKGFTNEPKRCKQCKAKVRERRPVIETPVTCAACGAATTVPFRPTRNEPVLCSLCFRGRAKVIPFRALAS